MRQTLMAVVWPAFLAAGLLEMLVFVIVDPGTLFSPGGDPVGLPRAAVYTLGFFLFWSATLVSSALTVWLAAAPEQRPALG
jgi:hypothetical protein